MKKILVIDNYDSFVYNLVHYLEELGAEVIVRRNDKISLEEVEEFDKILLSPGPGVPGEAGKLREIIRKFAATKSIFGVCLGQQAIGEVFGGKLQNLEKVYHGIATYAIAKVSDEPLFRNVPSHFEIGRYHSWVVSQTDFPAELEITAVDEDGQIMALRHREFDVRGVQFHPESILTPQGKKIIENWVNLNLNATK